MAKLGFVVLTLVLLATRQAAAHDPGVLENLVIANRILHDQGVAGGFGHVSVRSPLKPDHFLLARSMAPGLVTTADVIEHDRDGNPLDADGRTPCPERFIHSEIYKLRPDVRAIVYAPESAAVPFGVAGIPLRPIHHLSAFLGQAVPVFDIRNRSGAATDTLIRTPERGAALAETLGRAAAVLLRGDRIVVVGGSLAEAVFRAVYNDRNARLAADALRFGGGDIRFLEPEEAERATEATRGRIAHAWDLCKAEAFAAAPLLLER